MHLRIILGTAGLVLCFLLPPHILADAITYQISVDISSINSSSGFLDFDFAPGNDSQAAFVTISDFSTDGSLVGAPQVNGGVSGTLPGALTINKAISIVNPGMVSRPRPSGSALWRSAGCGAS